MQQNKIVGIIPSRDLTDSDKKYLRVSCENSLIQELVNRGVIGGKEDVEILDLLPEDLGLRNWDTPGLKMGIWTDWVKYQFPSSTAVCLYKVLQLSNKPKVSEIRVSRGFSSSIIGQYNLESCYAGLPIIENLKFATMSEEGRAVLERLTGKAVKEGVIGTVMEGYFTNPHFFSPQTVMNIQLKANYENTPGDRLVLGGYIAKPKGMRIS